MKVRTNNNEEVRIIKPEEVFYLRLNTYVRYWEDSDINGEEDISYEEQKDGKKPRMPFASADGATWQPVIDVKELRILDWPEGVEADVHYKVCDECDLTCLDKEMNPLCKYNPANYVPKFLQYDDDFKDGDYIVMRIDGKGYLVDFPEEYAEEWIRDILENSEC